MNEVNKVELSDNWRVVAYYDESPQNPRGDWDFVTGALTVSHDRNYYEVTQVHIHPGNLGGAWDRLGGTVASGHWYTEEDDPVIRWSRIFYGIELFAEQMDAGWTYWWIDPQQREENVKLGAQWNTREEQRVVVMQDVKTYQQWASGEVFGLSVEKLVTWSPVDDDDDRTREEWDVVESVWGFYEDFFDGRTLLMEARGICPPEVDPLIDAWLATNDARLEARKARA